MTQGLLKEIWQRPQDRQLLGVYADWLATNGDATRAEYMQLRLLEAPTAAQDKRAAALLKRNRGTWLGPARAFVYTWEESEETPGFIDKAQCTMANLAKGFEQVRSLGPKLCVRVTEPKAKRDVGALAKCPLGALYGLELQESDANFVTDDLLETLAPKLPGLRSLMLHPHIRNCSPDNGWKLALSRLEGLVHLDLGFVGWWDLSWWGGADKPDWEPWLEGLLASPVARSLRTLSLPAGVRGPWRARLATALPACRVTFRPR